jgi:hypothetical protein
MAVVSAATAIAFVMLAIACLSMFGLFGVIVWLLIYGLFHVASRVFLRYVGDEDDPIGRSHRGPSALANSRRRRR